MTQITEKETGRICFHIVLPCLSRDLPLVFIKLASFQLVYVLHRDETLIKAKMIVFAEYIEKRE